MTDKPSRLISISKKLAALGVIVASLGAVGYNVDLRFALASDVESTQEKNDEKHKQHEIRQLRAEARYIMDRIHHAKEDDNTDLVAELQARLKDIEMDIAALEKS